MSGYQLWIAGLRAWNSGNPPAIGPETREEYLDWFRRAVAHKLPGPVGKLP